MFKKILALLFITTLVLPVIAIRADSHLNSALDYLENNYSAQNEANRDWAAIGLGENGKRTNNIPTDASSLLSIERSVLARAAQGIDRADLVGQVEASFNEDQLGEPNLFNDDIFGLLAIYSTDPTWLKTNQGVFTTIINSQRPSGSFGFSHSGNGDTDMTAAAIWALSLAEPTPVSSLERASAYLTSTQNSDGGFGFQPGVASNIATSSWAMLAQATLGKSVLETRNYLINQQQSGGYWLEGDRPNYLNTAYVALALTNKKLPFVGKRPIETPSSPNQTISPVAPAKQAPTQPAPSTTSSKPATNKIVSQPTKKKPKLRSVNSSSVSDQSITICTSTASASATADGSSATASAYASSSCQ